MLWPSHGVPDALSRVSPALVVAVLVAVDRELSETCVVEVSWPFAVFKSGHLMRFVMAEHLQIQRLVWKTGRMYNPTKTWRKWHRKINLTQKRYATASALAATAVPALVMARGHLIDEVPEIPLVLETAVESTSKTSKAKEILQAIGAYDDVERAADSKHIRAGKGKMRNRRYVQRRGPLIIYKTNDGVEQSFRNLPGVELCCVDRLNLLQLAPGGHMGRFCVWSQAALDSLESFKVPNASMTNADIARIINSDEIQSVLKAAKEGQKEYAPKANAIKSLVALEKLDAYAAAKRKGGGAKHSPVEKKVARKAARKTAKSFQKQGKAFYEKISMQGDVCANGFAL